MQKVVEQLHYAIDKMQYHFDQNYLSDIGNILRLQVYCLSNIARNYRVEEYIEKFNRQCEIARQSNTYLYFTQFNMDWLK